MYLLAAFLAIPLIEIGLFIQVGGLIGLWPTLAVVIVTAVFGSALVRSQGLRALSDLRHALEDMRDPTDALAQGAMILLAGVLLLTPGFFTDAVGFLLLVPPLRVAALAALSRRIRIQRFTVGGATMHRGAPGPDHPGDVIDGDWHETPPNTPSTPSPWQRH